jgi:hypothetical protein
LGKERETLLAEQERILGSSVKSQTNHVVRFAARLAPENLAEKKEAALHLEKVAAAILKQHGLDHLLK